MIDVSVEQVTVDKLKLLTGRLLANQAGANAKISARRSSRFAGLREQRAVISSCSGAMILRAATDIWNFAK
jgi:hypothetical protein